MPNVPTSEELLVSGSHLLLNCRQQEGIRNGGVVISGDAIIDTGTRKELRERYPAADELHEPHGLIMPGLVNTHTNAPLTCFRGLADDSGSIRRFEEKLLPPESMVQHEMAYQGAQLAIAEMIKSGTTSFCDISFFSREVARAADEAGIRSWVGETLRDLEAHSPVAAEDSFLCVRELMENYRDRPLVTITVAPQSASCCGPHLLKKSKAVAEANNTLLVIHLPETTNEAETFSRRYGRTVVQYLDDLELLNERTLAVHCLHLEAGDVELLARQGVKVSHCQEANMKRASGTADLSRLLSCGVIVSIGTDSCTANNDADMFSELNCLAKAQKAAAMDPTVMNAETTLRLATEGGAAALGVADRIGTLAIGKKADLIILDLQQPHLTPLYNIPSHLVYAARGADVLHSIINGRIVMKDRQLLTLNEADIINGMKKIAGRILNFNKMNIPAAFQHFK